MGFKSRFNVTYSIYLTGLDGAPGVWSRATRGAEAPRGAVGRGYGQVNQWRGTGTVVGQVRWWRALKGSWSILKVRWRLMGGGCEEGAEAAGVSSLLTNVAGCPDSDWPLPVVQWESISYRQSGSNNQRLDPSRPPSGAQHHTHFVFLFCPGITTAPLTVTDRKCEDLKQNLHRWLKATLIHRCSWEEDGLLGSCIHLLFPEILWYLKVKGH